MTNLKISSLFSRIFCKLTDAQPPRRDRMNKTVQNVLFFLLVSTSVAVPFLIAKNVPSQSLASKQLTPLTKFSLLQRSVVTSFCSLLFLWTFGIN